MKIINNKKNSKKIMQNRIEDIFGKDVNPVSSIPNIPNEIIFFGEPAVSYEEVLKINKDGLDNYMDRANSGNSNKYNTKILYKIK